MPVSYWQIFKHSKIEEPLQARLEEGKENG